ncbi:MAG: glycosyltransferase family 4 protein [Acidobacterium ailaaui]|nr:glycosyltransferase family 4 protein [Pseudacidobacterium ailaaui]
MIKVYINGLFYRCSGIGRYYESLTREFAKRDVKIITSIPKKLKIEFEKDFKGIPNIEPIFVDYEKFSVKGFFNHSKILKSLEKKVDLFFYPHVNLPLYIPNNTLVTIHDLIPFTEYWDRNLFKKQIFKFYLIRAIKHSQKIIAISQATKNDLVNYFPEIEKKIDVIYRYVDDKFLNKNEFIRVINEPYILFVGNRKSHKNLNNLVLAFNEIKEEISVKLVIAGAKDKDNNEEDEINLLVDKLNLKDYVIEIIKPDDETLINLYKHSELFVFPSFYEGFGLPPLEAIACSCPVLASNIPILIEILGEGIACFDPHDPKNIAEKIRRIFLDTSLREKLIYEGKNRLKLYDKCKIINYYIHLFKEVIK